MSDIADESPDWSRPATLSLVKPAQPSRSRPSPENPPSPPRQREAEVFFTRAEFEAILSVYGRKVVEGEWRDYAIGASREMCVFAVHRRTSEQPLYRIEKRPKLAKKQGAFAVVAATGLVLKRGHDLAQVLKVFEKRSLRLIDA